MKKMIDKTPTPRTRASLAADLRNLGVERGMTLIVHSSLSSLGSEVEIDPVDGEDGGTIR